MRADYECKDCGYVFEYKKPYKEEFPKSLKCPKCNSMNAQKMLQASIIIPDSFKATNN